MLIHNIIPPTATVSVVSTALRAHCSQFIAASGGAPVYKLLPESHGTFKRVKVRFQRRKNFTSDIYEAAFGTGIGSFRERSVVTYGTKPMPTDDLCEYYIFPIDGYKFLYSRQVMDSTTAFDGVVDTLLSNMPLTEGMSLITDLLKFAYSQDDLFEGISSGVEVIFHNIPSYYAVRCDDFPNYQLLTR